MELVAHARDFLGNDERQFALVEQLEPFVPFNQVIAAGIDRAFWPVLILVGMLAEDNPQHRLASGGW